MLRVPLFCEYIAVLLRPAQSAAHDALEDKFDALLDSALFRVGLGLAVFSKDLFAVAYPVAEGGLEVSLKKSGQPHPDPDNFALFSPVDVPEDDQG